jgi:hypothetical protein
MEVRPDLQIQVILKALKDVILPAVDKDNKLAQEQTHLAIGTLQLMAKFLPIAYRYDRDELDRYVRLSRDLLAQIGNKADGTAINNLKTVATHGADVLERARAEPAEMEKAVFDLRATVGELIEAVHAGSDGTAKTAVQKLILAAAKPELERERAVVIDMGWETDPSTHAPPINTQLPPIGA